MLAPFFWVNVTWTREEVRQLLKSNGLPDDTESVTEAIVDIYSDFSRTVEQKGSEELAKLIRGLKVKVQ